MESEQEKFRVLLQKYNEGTCTEEEKSWLESWYLQWNENDKVTLAGPELTDARALIWEGVQENIQSPARIKLWPKLAAAASLLLAGGLSLLIYQHQVKNGARQIAKSSVYKNDITPGSVKATLTLADGSKITLDGAKNGALAKQTGIVITKAADGQLIYTISDAHSTDRSSYNTIETPKGGQYQIRLPDGTQVWLNSASVMKFPLSFAHSADRKVELSGEAYFEVAHDQLHPFIVNTDKQQVKVLGTHFDVNSYPDEPVTKTTLLEGSVKLNGGVVLKPGEQGTTRGSDTQVKQVNADEEIDWKNKQFILNDENLQQVMRRLSRWYNVEVVYEGEPADVNFVGVMSSTRNISSILKLMERTGKVHFKVEGKTVTVLK